MHKNNNKCYTQESLHGGRFSALSSHLSHLAVTTFSQAIIMMTFVRAASLAALVWLTASKQVVAYIDDPDFEDREIFQGDPYPVDFTWTPEGQMLVTQKEGLLLIYNRLDGDYFTKKAVALDLTSVICDNSERGLGGVQVHPNFGNSDRWIYLFCTFKKNGNCDQDQYNGPVNRLSRFWLQEGSDTIEKSSEVVLFDTPPLGFRFHNGGKIEFGKDGYLYVTVGESGLKEKAQSKSNLLGSLIRIKDDGGIPDDNPFNGSNDVRCYKDGVPPQGSPDGARCKEIYSIGLRNPFRMAMDPNTSKTRCFINDVGASTWEEVSIASFRFLSRFELLFF
jgi:glucose/arabinose dehydrogenase